MEIRSEPKLKRVLRLDSTPMSTAYFTPEGYLIDTPILTSTGIFEYGNSDGSVRRELRLPEEVFAEDSLATYEGAPIIITHDAGLVTKDNVADNGIGTILTKGFRDGDNVRAKIVIHDTKEMKASGLKELSLGYNLDLDETPGEWEGQHYDAIQRNIRINHLALVREARAGDKARLNIDSRDAKTKGVKVMSNMTRKTERSDGVLSPEELKKAIEEYKARHPQPEKQDNEAPVPAEEDKGVPVPAKAQADEDPVIAPSGSAEGPEEKAAAIRETQEAKKDAEGEGGAPEDANDTIARQDEDIQTLLDIIDTLLAERDFKESNKDGDEAPAAEEGEQEMAEDCGNKDGDDDDVPSTEGSGSDSESEPIPTKEESDIKPGEVMNADSIDAIVRARVKIGIAAEKLNLDGVEHMSLSNARKAVIKAVRPTMNLDGKSSTYIEAAFDHAYEEISRKSRKGTEYQKKQMFNKDAQEIQPSGPSAADARQRMIERRQKRNAKEEK